jgi:CBS domain containing-hemolysin-like protein
MTLSLVLLLFAGVSALVLLSAFFSGAETAITSCDKSFLLERSRKGDRRAATARRLFAHMERLLGAILVGNNLVNVSVTALASLVVFRITSDTWESIVNTALVTPVLLVLGEFLPKSIARAHANRFTLLAARPLRAAQFVFFPLVYLISRFGSFLADRLGPAGPGRARQPLGTVSRDDLRLVAEMAAEQGVVARSTGRMLHSVFDLEAKPVAALMTPLARAAVLPEEMTVGAFLAFAAGRAQVLYPLYEEQPDRVTGILDVRDILYLACRDLGSATAGPLDTRLLREWARRDLPETSETRTVAELLHDLRYERAPLVVVRDRPGGRVTGVLPVDELADSLLRAGAAAEPAPPAPPAPPPELHP